MIKRVLVYTYGNQSHENTIRVAANFAAAHEARLTGLFVKPDLMGYTSVYGTNPMNLARTFYDLQDDYSKAAHAEFDKVVNNLGVKCEWHEVEEYENTPRPSAYADVIFVSQPDRESSVIFNDTDFVDQIIVSNGLPVVVIPRSWDKSAFGSQPLLAWRETKEAIGAVRHTLGLMRKANVVDVLTVHDRIDSEENLIEGIGICEYLAEHGITAKFYSEAKSKEDKSDADTLLRHVKNRANDLVIAGGYGHSRIREIVLGGMTRSLIKQSPVPVLLAH